MSTSIAPAASRSHSFVRWIGALLLVAHGAVHAMGALLLWQLGEPGSLTYADATPEAGTVAGFVAGLAWVIGGGLFMVAGIRLAQRRSWAPIAVAASLVSLPPVALMASNGPMGVMIDVVVLSVALVIWWAERQPVSQD